MSPNVIFKFLFVEQYVFALTMSLLQRENLVASNSQVRQVGHWVDFAKQKTDEEIVV